MFFLPSIYLQGLLIAVAAVLVVSDRYFSQFFNSRITLFKWLWDTLKGCFFYQKEHTVWTRLKRRNQKQIPLPAIITLHFQDLASSQETAFPFEMESRWLNLFNYFILKYQLGKNPLNFYITGYWGTGKSTLGNNLASIPGDRQSLFMVSPMEQHGSQDLTYYGFQKYGLNLNVADAPGIAADFPVEKVKRVLKGYYHAGEQTFSVTSEKPLDADTRRAHCLFYVCTAQALYAVPNPDHPESLPPPSPVVTPGRSTDEEGERIEGSGSTRTKESSRLERERFLADRRAYAEMCLELKMNTGIGVSLLSEVYPELLNMSDAELWYWKNNTWKTTTEYRKLRRLYGPAPKIFPLFYHQNENGKKSYAVDVVSFEVLDACLHDARK
jgi:hypothetical protein